MNKKSRQVDKEATYLHLVFLSLKLLRRLLFLRFLSCSTAIKINTFQRTGQGAERKQRYGTKGCATEIQRDKKKTHRNKRNDTNLYDGRESILRRSNSYCFFLRDKLFFFDIFSDARPELTLPLFFSKSRWRSKNRARVFFSLSRTVLRSVLFSYFLVFYFFRDLFICIY